MITNTPCYEWLIICSCIPLRYTIYVLYRIEAKSAAKAKREAQLNAKKEADEKRKAAAEGKSSLIIVSIHAYILIHNLFLETFLEAIAKREAQLQDKKEADEKRKIAAEGKYCWIGYKNMLRFISMLSSHYLIYQCLV